MDDLSKFDLQLFAEEEKTEEPTPHKKREVRKEGQVAKSSDLSAVANLIAVFVLLFFLYQYFIEQLCWLVSFSFMRAAEMNINNRETIRLFMDSSLFMLKFLAPVFAVGAAAGLVANLGQVGFMFSPKAIQPKLSNMSPIQGFKKIFSKRAIVELFKALLKITVVGWVAFVLVKKNFDKLLFLSDMSLGQIVVVVAEVLFRVGAGAIGIFFVIAVLDYIFQRYDFKQRIKMTKKEVKDEFKQTEGDPQIRSKIKEKQQEMAQKRMMQEVPEATVVVTNPTHYAAALKYNEDEQEAPEVVAKGMGFVAKKIKETAEEHEVPVIQDENIARFIYKNVEIGSEIPPELYKAVAEILAMIYRLRKK